MERKILVKAVILLTQSLTTMIQPTSLSRGDYALPIDENRECVVANEILSEDEKKDGKHPIKWECSSECKPLTETEVGAIVSLGAAFENPVQEVQHLRDR